MLDQQNNDIIVQHEKEELKLNQWLTLQCNNTEDSFYNIQRKNDKIIVSISRDDKPLTTVFKNDFLEFIEDNFTIHGKKKGITSFEISGSDLYELYENYGLYRELKQWMPSALGIFTSTSVDKIKITFDNSNTTIRIVRKEAYNLILTPEFSAYIKANHSNTIQPVMTTKMGVIGFSISKNEKAIESLFSLKHNEIIIEWFKNNILDNFATPVISFDQDMGFHRITITSSKKEGYVFNKEFIEFINLFPSHDYEVSYTEKGKLIGLKLPFNVCSDLITKFNKFTEAKAEIKGWVNANAAIKAEAYQLQFNRCYNNEITLTINGDKRQNYVFNQSFYNFIIKANYPNCEFILSSGGKLTGFKIPLNLCEGLFAMYDKTRQASINNEVMSTITLINVSSLYQMLTSAAARNIIPNNDPVIMQQSVNIVISNNSMHQSFINKDAKDLTISK